MGIGAMILQALEARNMSQKALAEELKIATTTLNGYIKGRHEPDYATLKAIASILDVTTDYLLEFKPSSVFGKDELFIVTQYRSFDKSQKEIVLEQIKLISSQNERNEKGTI